MDELPTDCLALIRSYLHTKDRIYLRSVNWFFHRGDTSAYFRIVLADPSQRQLEVPPCILFSKNNDIIQGSSEMYTIRGSSIKEICIYPTGKAPVFNYIDGLVRGLSKVPWRCSLYKTRVTVVQINTI